MSAAIAGAQAIAPARTAAATFIEPSRDRTRCNTGATTSATRAPRRSIAGSLRSAQLLRRVDDARERDALPHARRRLGLALLERLERARHRVVTAPHGGRPAPPEIPQERRRREACGIARRQN